MICACCWVNPLMVLLLLLPVVMLQLLSPHELMTLFHVPVCLRTGKQ